MQRTEGFCIHCSAYVVRDQIGVLVTDDGGSTCGEAGYAHQLDDEEDDDE